MSAIIVGKLTLILPTRKIEIRFSRKISKKNSVVFGVIAYLVGICHFLA